MICNICRSKDSFEEYITGRNNKRLKCSVCKSQDRHRALVHILNKKKVLNRSSLIKSDQMCLHLAPEIGIAELLRKHFRSGYIASDPLLEQNIWKFTFPQDFEKIPSNTFNLIIHQATVEYFPGPWKNHYDQFARILKTGGNMFFTTYTEGLNRSETYDSGFTDYSDMNDHKIYGKDWIEYCKQKFTVFEMINVNVPECKADGIVFHAQL
jgi:hypothetical protein